MSPKAHMVDLSALPRHGGNLRYRVPPLGRNGEPVVERDEPRDLTLVRLLRDVRKTGTNYMGSPLLVAEDVYLDGTYVRTGYTVDRKHRVEQERKTLAAEATVRAARTDDTIDFGRFQAACVALVTQIEQVKAQGDYVSQEQEERIFRGYQGILAWRAELERQVRAVDSSIEVVRMKIVDVVQ